MNGRILKPISKSKRSAFDEIALRQCAIQRESQFNHISTSVSGSASIQTYTYTYQFAWLNDWCSYRVKFVSSPCALGNAWKLVCKAAPQFTQRQRYKVALHFVSFNWLDAVWLHKTSWKVFPWTYYVIQFVQSCLKIENFAKSQSQSQFSASKWLNYQNIGNGRSQGTTVFIEVLVFPKS